MIQLLSALRDLECFSTYGVKNRISTWGKPVQKKALATPKLGVAGILYLWIIDLKLTTNSKTINPEFFNHSYFLQIYIIQAILVKLVRIGQKIVKFWTRHFGIGCYIETVKEDSILSSIHLNPRRIQNKRLNCKNNPKLWLMAAWSGTNTFRDRNCFIAW